MSKVGAITRSGVACVMGLCADQESFVMGGPKLLFFDEGREDPNNTKSGPSSARQRNAMHQQ